MIPDTIHTAPTRSRRWRRPISRRAAIGLTIAVFALTALAFWISFGLSLCGLFGETCSPGTERAMQVLSSAGLVLAIGGPILVAWLRRAAVWALSPLVVAAVLIVGGNLLV